MTEPKKNSSVGRRRLTEGRWGRGCGVKGRRCWSFCWTFYYWRSGGITPSQSHKSFFNKLFLLEALTDSLLQKNPKPWELGCPPLPLLPEWPAASGKPKSFPPECAVSWTPPSSKTQQWEAALSRAGRGGGVAPMQSSENDGASPGWGDTSWTHRGGGRGACRGISRRSGSRPKSWFLFFQMGSLLPPESDEKAKTQPYGGCWASPSPRAESWQMQKQCVPSPTWQRAHFRLSTPLYTHRLQPWRSPSMFTHRTSPPERNSSPHRLNMTFDKDVFVVLSQDTLGGLVLKRGPQHRTGP